MKKRILSLILAVCMVAVAVPALLLPTIAAENAGFTTTFSKTENWPSYTTGVSFDGYNGNWSVGHFASGAYVGFTNIEKKFNILNLSAGSQWNRPDGGGLYLDGGHFILCGGSVPYMGDGGPTYAMSVTYSAMYEGTVDLSVVSIAPDTREANLPAGATAAMYFAVLINDEMIFPNKGGSVLDPADFALVSEASDILNHQNVENLKNVEVNIGDTIHFVVAKYNTWYGTMVPSVTYHDGYQVVPSRMGQSFGPANASWPVERNLNGVGELVQTDALWSLGQYADGTFTAYAVQERNALIGCWGGVSKDTINFSSANGIIIQSGQKTHEGAFMLNSETNLPAFRGEALACGKAEFGIKSGLVFLVGSNNAAVKNAEAHIDVYVNDVKVGTLTIKSDAKGSAKLVSTITGVDIKKGDSITYVAQKPEGVRYVNAQPVITYTDITSFMASTSEGKYDMEMDKAKVVLDQKIGLQFNAYATIDTYRDATAANVYIWDASVTGEKTLANATAVVPMSVNTVFAYSATYSEFNPEEMTETITAQVVVLKGEEEICKSDPATFTVAEVAQEQYDASFSEKEKDQLVAIMNYGAYAQKYFKHNVDNLANKGLDADLATIDVSKYYYNSVFDGKNETAPALLTYSDLSAFSLYIEDEISIRLYIDLNEYEKNAAEDMYIQYGKTEDECKSNNAPQLPVDRENASALLQGITLDQLSQQYTMRFVSAERTKVGESMRLVKYYGYTWTYSVESFAARMLDSTEENLPELLCAMMELSKLA